MLCHPRFPGDVAVVREMLEKVDGMVDPAEPFARIKEALGEARKLFATSRNVAERLERSTGLRAEGMPHPPQELPYRPDADPGPDLARVVVLGSTGSVGRSGLDVIGHDGGRRLRAWGLGAATNWEAIVEQARRFRPRRVALRRAAIAWWGVVLGNALV